MGQAAAAKADDDSESRNAEQKVEQKAEQKVQVNVQVQAQAEAVEQAEEKTKGPAAEAKGEAAGEVVEPEAESEMRLSKVEVDKGEVEASKIEAALAKKTAIEVCTKAATAEASAAESCSGDDADEGAVRAKALGPSMADMAKYKELQLKEKAGLKAKATLHPPSAHPRCACLACLPYSTRYATRAAVTNGRDGGAATRGAGGRSGG